jgi:hypothetical protein
MKHIALLLAISFVASGAQAAEYGLGASLGSFSDTQEIFVPIQVREGLRFEPSVTAQVATLRADSFNTQKDRFYVLKAGLFSVRPLHEGINLLTGGRLGYVKQRSTLSNDSGSSSSTEFTGFTVEPTLGMEYMPIKQLAMGAEVSLDYRQVKNEDANDNTSNTKTLSTSTRITVKFFY